MVDYEDTDDPGPVGKSVGRKDQKLLEEIRRNFANDKAYWSQNYAEGAIDMRYLAGDAWDEDERDARSGRASGQAGDAEKRLCLNFDELNAPVRQCVNNFLLNKPAVAIDPKGDGANDKTAEFRGDAIRQIEYRSNGTTAYSTAFTCMVQRGYGFYRINREYAGPRTMNQELTLEAVHNPDSVYGDPNGLEIDGSDWKRCFVLKNWTHEEFRREWPDAEVVSFGEDLVKEYSDWLTEKTVQVAEYWKVKEKRAQLVYLDRPIATSDGKQLTELIVEEYPGAQVVKKTLVVDGQVVANITGGRPTKLKTVCQYITNGLEILEENEQPEECEWIPIVPMYGEELYVPGIQGPQRIFRSLIRLPRDAQTALSYTGTTQMELVGQIPKTPYIGYEGQFEGHTKEWKNVNRVRIPYLQVRAQTDATGDTVLPLPQQTHYEPAIESLEMLKESLRRSILSQTGGSPLPTAALRRNEKSKIALDKIEQTEQVGAYHFTEHAKLSIAHGGRIMNALLAPTYDTKRLIPLRGEDQTFRSETNHQPVMDPQTQQPQMGADGQPVTQNVFEQGEHEVTISTGPSYASQREAVENFVGNLVGTPGLIEAAIANPGSTAAKILALSIRLQNLGPLGNQMVDELDPQAEGGQMDPAAENAQLKQALQKAQAMMQELQQLADKNKTEIEKANISAREGLERDNLNNKAKKEIALIDLRKTVAVALISKGLEADQTLLEHQADMAAHELELQHEKDMQAADHSHEAGLQESAQAAAAASQDAGHEQTMEQQQQAAELAPEPAAE